MLNSVLLATVFKFLLIYEVYSEITQRCSDSPGNICGSDFKLYVSECDFIRAKDLNSDLTILDMEDCFSANVNNNVTNSNYSRTQEDALTASDYALDNITNNSTSGSSNLNDSRSLRGSGLSIINNSDSYNGTSTNHYNVSELGIESGTVKDSSNSVTYLNYEEVEDNVVFKEIEKTNSKILKIVVENFDISNFVVGNGKYNIKTISRAILELILKIIKNHRSKMGKDTDINNKKLHSNNSVDSDSKITVNETNNDGEILTKVYSTNINVTLMFTGNYTEKGPEIYNQSNNLSVEANDKFNGSSITHSNQTQEKIYQRSLVELNNEPKIESEDLITNGCTSNLPNRPENVELGFYCNFENNLNITEQTRSIIDITNFILENNLENNFGLSGEKEDFFTNGIFDFGNYFRGLSEKSEDNERNVSDGNIPNLDDYKEVVLNYNENKNKSEINVEIGELYVFFNFEGLKKDKEDYNLNLNVFDDNYSNKTTLRIANENDYNVTNLAINETTWDYPGAFDRVRGQNCIVNCTDTTTGLYCASNGITYKSICEFRNAQCNDKSLIFISFGECPPIVIMS
ncbi:hypothetical protein FG379_000091 [Cryptosporidium bovis]|uniref:uncharacterized protein n=1 Tax=Cryptosporidium bovis TaxID=310047 RepID=UPI00351A0012|nr:hypothetical protein FG379_000091 [Cryptosporidium bovis]